jgi:sensor histidine kinase YesM
VRVGGGREAFERGGFGVALLIAWAVSLGIAAIRAVLLTAWPPRQIVASDVFLLVGLEWLLWAVLAPIIVWWARRVPVRRGTWWWAAPLHVVASIGVTVAHTTALFWIGSQIGQASSSFRALLYGRSQVGLLTYVAVWLAVEGTIRWQEQRARDRRQRELELERSRLEAALTKAQLDALRLQLQPHFLFNALNAVSTLIHDDPDRADRVLTGLGELLRMVLERGSDQDITLAVEMGLVDRYLAIETLRLGDRLRIVRRVAPETERALVPPFLLQPLVENAVRHGVASRIAGGSVEIEAGTQGGRLRLFVRDSGPGLGSGGAAPGFGLGLNNTRERLLRLYGRDHTFSVRDRDDGGVEVAIELPHRERIDAATTAEATP